MKKQKKACFYFINSTDIQEYTGVILEAAKLNYFVDIMVFDNTSKKRNFYYYSLEDFKTYFNSLFELNELKKNYSVKKYHANDEKRYVADYREASPDLVFTRDVNKVKYVLWKPIMERQKTVLFVWEAPETKIAHNNLLTIARYNDGDAGWITNSTIHSPTKLRYAAQDHEFLIDEEIYSFCNSDKTCFMAETWSRGLEDKQNNLPMVLEVVKTFKEAGYKIAWKMREKGYPAQANNSHNFVREVAPLVDLVITKDLNYPSSLYYLTENCDVSCTFNVTTSALDSMLLTQRRFVFLSKYLSDRYRSKLRNSSASWGKYYENLSSYVHLYDEKYSQESIKNFVSQRLGAGLELIEVNDTDYPHRDLMLKLDSMIF